MMTKSDQPSPQARRELLGAGAAVSAIGAFVLWQTFAIRQPKGYTSVGPRVMPVAVSVGLTVLGLLFTARVALGKEVALEAEMSEEHTTGAARPPATLLLVMVGYAVAFRPLGYVLSTTLFLPIAAFILGSRRLKRDVVVAIAMSVVVYLVFRRGLGIQLPSGPLGDRL